MSATTYSTDPRLVEKVPADILLGRRDKSAGTFSTNPRSWKARVCQGARTPS